jgi:hypothetical protein
VQPAVALAVDPLDPAVGGVVAAELAAAVADHAAVAVARGGELDVRGVREGDLAEQPEQPLRQGGARSAGTCTVLVVPVVWVIAASPSYVCCGCPLLVRLTSDSLGVAT